MAVAARLERQKSAEEFAREKDSLYVLPLSTIPLKTKSLRQARLIKDERLEGVVELFSGEGTGSGRVKIDALAREFAWSQDPAHPDLAMLRRLSRLPSYDVYSLRVLLRDLDIRVDNVDDLRLSAQTSRDLTSYMSTFTRPLIRQVYGDGDVAIKDFGDIVGLFRQPNLQLARQKLGRLADRLGISLEEVPKFLEDFGDIFLSLSYYKSYLDNIEPRVRTFIVGFDVFRNSHELRQNRLLMNTCDGLEAKLGELTTEMSSRFQNFDRETEDMWTDVCALSFRRIEMLIASHHTTIGGILCALGTKMNAWEARFPDTDTGGPVKRAEFIMTDMRQGLDNIRRIEHNPPIAATLG